MKRKLTVFSLALVIAMLLSGCGVQIKSVSPKKDSLELRENESAVIELEYVFSEENVTEEETAKAIENANIAWTSSDESVVKVEAGKVIASEGGEATVTITAHTNEGEVVIPIEVKVIADIEKITVPEEITLQIGGTDTANLGTTVAPKYATIEDVDYVSSDENVATVDYLGNVKAVGKGLCAITARAGDVTADTNVNVTIKPTGIGLSATGGWIYKGGSYTIYPYAMPDGAEEMTYTFTSSDASIASVNENGVIYGKGVGTATITVTGTANIIANNGPVQNGSVEANELASDESDAVSANGLVQSANGDGSQMNGSGINGDGSQITTANGVAAGANGGNGDGSQINEQINGDGSSASAYSGLVRADELIATTKEFTVTYTMTIKAKPVYHYSTNSGSTTTTPSGGGGGDVGGGSTSGGGSGGAFDSGDLLPGDPWGGGQVGGR